jgi:HAE1 family hydrophobic/amphiphilic exporter-1
MKLEKYMDYQITRHNMYTSTEISGSAAQDIVVVQLLKSFKKLLKKLPRGYDIDWAGISADEVSQGNQAIWVFLICLGLCIWF